MFVHVYTTYLKLKQKFVDGASTDEEVAGDVEVVPGREERAPLPPGEGEM